MSDVDDNDRDDQDAILQRLVSADDGQVSLPLSFLGPSAATIIAGTLVEKNPSPRISPITTLDLAYNHLGSGGANTIFECLAQGNCSSLTTLNLNRNMIDGNASTAILDCLTRNVSLTNLHLGGNQLGVDGAVAIAQGLAHNMTLEKLYIGGNGMSRQGGYAIGHGLAHNSVLVTLDLTQNDLTVSSMDPGGLSTITATLNHNMSLETLFLHTNGISDDAKVAESIQSSLTRNRDANVLCRQLTRVKTDTARVLHHYLPFELIILVMHVERDEPQARVCSETLFFQFWKHFGYCTINLKEEMERIHRIRKWTHFRT